MQYIIGIDIGTTNTKAVAFTSDGEVLETSGASYSVFADAEGRHELDPDQLLDAFFSVLDAILQKTIHVKNNLAGISLSCAMHSLIAVDSVGRPLTRALTWADRRSEVLAARLKASDAGRLIYRKTGTPIHPMSPLSKLLWLREKDVALFDRAERFISIKEYIWWSLFGLYQIDHSIASATGLFDIYTRDWLPEALTLAGIQRGRLSEPVPCTHQLYSLLPAQRSRIALPENIPFIIGASDGCLANLGSGAVLQGETALTIGTSGAIRMTVTVPAHDPAERIFNYILSNDLYVSGGATNNGGNSLQWFVEQFSDGVTASTRDTAARITEVATVPAGCDGLVFLPYLLGERAPIWNADAKGVWFGIRSIHTERHFLRSVLEGVSLSLYHVGQSLEETIGPIRRIYASGGFTKSPAWLQMVADIFSKEVLVTAVADASAVGAAIFGFYSLGVFPSLTASAGLIKVENIYIPDASRHRVYLENFRIYLALYNRLNDLM